MKQEQLAIMKKIVDLIEELNRISISKVESILLDENKTRYYFDFDSVKVNLPIPMGWQVDNKE